MSGATVVFLFDTTHHALWAEEVAVQAGIPVDVVPAPPDRGEARCDLALATFARTAEELGRALDNEGVEFYWPADVGPRISPSGPGTD